MKRKIKRLLIQSKIIILTTIVGTLGMEFIWSLLDIIPLQLIHIPFLFLFLHVLMKTFNELQNVSDFI